MRAWCASDVGHDHGVGVLLGHGGRPDRQTVDAGAGLARAGAGRVRPARPPRRSGGVADRDVPGHHRLAGKLHFRWHGDAFTDGQVIDTITPRVATAAAGSTNDAKKRDEPVWDPKLHERLWRAVWAYSAKRAARDRKTLTLQENKAKAVIAGEKTARTPRFVKTSNGTVSLDQAALSRARRLVGLKGYVTNLPASVMPATEVIASYHSLWQVEASFRLSKSDLRGRPIFHHERDAIEAHLTVVITALAIARHLQDTTNMSIKKIVRALRPLQQITVTIAATSTAPPTPSPTPPATSSPRPAPPGQHTKLARLGWS